MSTMLMLWITSYFGGLLLALRHPIFPLVSYLVFYYLPPRVNWWGRFLPDLRWSLLAAFVLAGSVVLLRTSLERLKDEKNPALIWLVLLGLNTIVVTAWALQQARSWLFTVAFLKLVLIYVLIPAAIRAPVHFDVFGAVHIAGATYWGYKAWDDPQRTAGRLEAVGGPDTQNDNLAAAHLATVIPFVALYVLTLRRKFPRVAAAIGGAFIVNVFILCNSRGAMLGLLTAGFAAVVLAGKGRRIRLIGVGLAGALAFVLLADPEFIARQQTTADPQDSSALSRFEMWRAGAEIIRDYPFGGGGRAFHILSPRYLSDLLEQEQAEERSAHNTYVQLGTDWGIQGLVLFAGFVFVTFRMLHRIRRRAPENSWYFYRSLVVQVALIGTLTAGWFSSRFYGESIYWMCALAFALHRVQSTELAGMTATAAEPAAAPTAGWHQVGRPPREVQVH